MKKIIIITACVLVSGLLFFYLFGRNFPLQHSVHKRNILTEAGQDAFGTIQEVITVLEKDQETDWEKVNLEALRAHLLDMNDMTLNVEVISQNPIAMGMAAIIRPTTQRSAHAMERILLVHPPQLERETGWKMEIEKKGKNYTLKIRAERYEDVAKIRGLGYIGIMARGGHHQLHHWTIASGGDPHGH